jgi:predicted Zn-dependent peptidase
LTKEDILNAAKKYIYPDKLYIVVSGDANAVKDKLNKFGEVQVFDSDGNKIEASK